MPIGGSGGHFIEEQRQSPISHDTGLYKLRNIVERFFCTMKDMRRNATRFEKPSRNFLAMIHIRAIRLWMD